MTQRAGAPRRWRVAPGSPFAWAHAQSGHVLYHRPSGQTHFLNETAALLLGRCLLEPRNADEAAASLARLQGAEPDPQLPGHVAELLLHFEALGLVETVGS